MKQLLNRSMLQNVCPLQKNIEELQKENHQWLEETFQHVVQLEEITLNVNSLSSHGHLDFLIKEME